MTATAEVPVASSYAFFNIRVRNEVLRHNDADGFALPGGVRVRNVTAACASKKSWPT